MRILFETKPCGLGGVFSYPTQSHFYHPGKGLKKTQFYSVFKVTDVKNSSSIPSTPQFSSCSVFSVCFDDNTVLTGSS